MPGPTQRAIGSTGLTVDTLGLGCGPLGNLFRAISNEDAAALLDVALYEGFRFFDTAPHYGQGLSERRVGDALRRARGAGYVLSTKVGRLLKRAGYAHDRHGFLSPMPFDIEYDYSYDGVMRSVEDSYQRLGLDRIDILYLHDIGAFTHGEANEHHFPIAMEGGYRALDELRRSGEVAAIGLGVNECEVCEAALDHGDWDVFLLAGRYTLLEQGALDTLLPKCIDRNCSIVVGAPYNSGILAAGVRGDGHYQYEAPPESVKEKVARIEAVCEDFAVPLAAAALQFPLAHPAVVSVMPGTSKIRHLNEMRRLMRNPIPADFWQALRQEGLVREDAPVPPGAEESEDA